MKYVSHIEDVIDKINDCEAEGHFQQIAYSAYRSVMTAICFDCGEVTTNFRQTGD